MNVRMITYLFFIKMFQPFLLSLIKEKNLIFMAKKKW